MRLTGAPTGTPWLERDSGPGRKPAHRASAGRKPDPAGEGSPSPPSLTTAGMAKADKLGLSGPLANKRVALSLQPGSTDFLPSRFPPVEPGFEPKLEPKAYFLTEASGRLGKALSELITCKPRVGRVFS